MVGKMVSAIALTMIATAGVACSTEGSNASPAPSAVEIKGFLFRPSTLSVTARTAVIWTNRDDIAHTITSGAPGEATGDFDSGDRTLGQAFRQTFPTAGTFTYFCRNHNSMTGRVTVT